MRLWKKSIIAPEGKYLVQRRDGTVPEWPNFVLGGRDPTAPFALRAYADATEKQEGHDAQFVQDVRDLAVEFEEYLIEHGEGDPMAPPHRKDDPATIAKMNRAKGS